MPDDSYDFEFDKKIGRFVVDMAGPVNAGKIQKTTLKIINNEKWKNSDRTMLWLCEKASIQDSFKFTEVFKTTEKTRNIVGKGKSAVVIPKNDQTIKILADFYKGVFDIKSDRKIEIFYSRDEAIAWLDS